MRWSQLATAIGAPSPGADADPEVSAIAYDSRQVTPGAVFVAIPGQHHDGHSYVQSALGQGAVVVVVEHEVPSASKHSLVVVKDARRGLASLAATFYGHPADAVPVVGITGTDGKTTTATLLQAALTSSLGKAGSLSTVDFRLGDEIEPNLTRQTTLESLEVQARMRAMVDQGCRAIVLEATSHGLALGRLDEVRFAGAVYTSITHEHLDFHKSWEAYFQAKASLLDRATQNGGFAVLNRDDSRAYSRLRERASDRLLTYSAAGAGDADLRAERVTPGSAGLEFVAVTPAGTAQVGLATGGRWNVGNALAAIAAGLLLEQPLSSLVAGMAKLSRVPGRMESVDLGQSFSVVVDYAHTPAALTLALHELRGATAGRLWVVFGSAGERDVAKRAAMGRIAAELADQIVLTSEDPRSEDAEAIIDQIWAGAVSGGADPETNLHRDADRYRAIQMAVGSALPGDTVLLAGKGHEHSIIWSAGPEPWEERAAAESALRETRGL
ncbi:MAG TPA: UDP-N-acetylmuramoyl-L-alanyl-D-glutamate--2,6-diaminopimelate ligase [Candidatus Saccharimonadales bacterium]|nr:UDP-N-acetylmuramoyl-L-alanyl-D-glutamate--2,6-diaminopimelate ligase [Candidatus Saccharimonadales bacterium]